MFCPGWQIDAGCFVRGGKKWHGMFCPGMFCPTFLFFCPENVVCFLPKLHVFKCTFFMEANNMDLDQTAHKCLPYVLSKNISRWRRQPKS